MKIEKIKEQLPVEDQFDVELEGCRDDCKEYFSKYQGEYEYLKKYGAKVDGGASIAEIRNIKETFGFYCYRLLTPKTSIYL